MEKEKIKKEDSDNPEELCCADKNICSIDCVPKESSESKCGCGGCC